MEYFAIRQRTTICGVIVGLLAAGCGGGQSQIGALPQSAPASLEPNAAACPTPGKTYTTGNGHVSTQFGSLKVPLGSPITFRVAISYKGWPEGRQLLEFAPQLTTCGAAWGKKPIGKVTRYNWGSSKWSCGGNGKCDVTLGGYISYELPSNLPNGKPWKYDLLRLRPKPPKVGYGAIPSIGIEVVK
jgi:hypothetical protein